MDETTIVTAGIQCSHWIEIPKPLLQWRAGLGTRPGNDCVLPEFNAYGVYLLAESPAEGGYDDQAVMLASDPIIYVGKAGLQTFFKRWTNTHAAWKKLGDRYKAANGAMRYFCSVATVLRKEIPLRVWSEEMTMWEDAVYIEGLEQVIRKLLRRQNAYFRDYNLDRSN